MYIGQKIYDVCCFEILERFEFVKFKMEVRSSFTRLKHIAGGVVGVGRRHYLVVSVHFKSIKMSVQERDFV